jgi:predicted secreted hydrolase
MTSPPSNPSASQPQALRSGSHRRRPLPRALAVTALLGGIAGLAGLLALGAWILGRPAPPHRPIAASWRVADALGANDPSRAKAPASGFARARGSRPFIFPADHGPHPDFRTEWWYYTGNLASRDGRRFGFQLTFFRNSLAPPGDTAAVRTSAWATRQVYFAHFALTDAAGRRFHATERWERGAAGLAGAQAEPFRVWVGDWSATAASAGSSAAPRNAGSTASAGPDRNAASPATSAAGAKPPAAATPPMHLTARAGADALDLLLTGSLPPVLQGDHGFSPKSAEPGNASYYYSLPRLAAAGTLRLGGETVAVAGSAWMDREWSTSSLAPDEVGWDWFALQLDDGWELMLYRLRRRPRNAAAAATAASLVDLGDLVDPASRATLIAPDGTTEVLPPTAWRLAETAAWTSPVTGTRYPAAWRLSLPAAAGPPRLAVAVQPILPDQELALSFRYWEGAVDVRGTHAGRAVTGRGYVELTGY